MLLECRNLKKEYPGKELFSEASFRMEKGQRFALVGENGAGKTTLIRILLGELIPDEGEVVFQGEPVIGYLAQTHDTSSENTIREEVINARADLLRMERELTLLTGQIHALSEMPADTASSAPRSAESPDAASRQKQLDALILKQHDLQEEYDRKGGYALNSRTTGILKGLGFSEEDFSRSISTLSGGQKTRVALGRLLLMEPDLLILDEPTNHLDLNSVSWLEKYLESISSALIVVSHDRYFLDKVSDHVLELSGSRLSLYTGNYTAFAEKKAARLKEQLRAYESMQRKIGHEEAVIEKLKSFNREKSVKRARSREKQLAKVERVEKPEAQKEMHIRFQAGKESGNDVLSVQELSMGFGDRRLFSGLSFALYKGEHTALIGDNGTGKTTLLKLLTGGLKPVSGSFLLGANVRIGYYDQEQQLFHEDFTVFEELRFAHPKLNDTELRSTLARFLFFGEDVFKEISALSGGERGRLALARLMLSDANFLILDEPTNHLDMSAREVLEEALNEYTGTLLYVSHDRYFINKTAKRVLELENGGLKSWLGNYDDYLNKKEELSRGSFAQGPAQAPEKGLPKPEVPAAKTDYQEKKLKQSRERSRKRRLAECEESISAAEGRIGEIDANMALPEICTDAAKLSTLQAEKDALRQKLEALYADWEKLMEEEDGPG